MTLTVMLAGAPALAQTGVPAHWATLTTMDVEAAYRMLLEDHPGAAPEVGDEGFRTALAAGYAKAKARASKVDSYDGYVATLAAFAVGFGDKHIWSRPLYVTDRPDWAGIVLVRRGGQFVVADEADASEGEPLKGGRLVSCDGIAADRMADERLGEFRVARGIEAQLIQRAGFLLLDEGNPFLKRPKACDFQQGGQTRTVPLRWRGIWRHDYMARLAAAPTRGAAGFGVRQVGEGHWIAVQSFSDRAVPVVEEVRAKVAELRKSPFLVLDLRGNGGGNSKFGRDIADALLGKDFVEAALGGGEEGEGCSKVWRLSDRNLKQVEYYKNELGPKQGKEAQEAFAKEYEKLAAAKAAGKSFDGKPRCTVPGGGKSKRLRLKPASSGKIVLLTDNACFSSCLMVADEFRRLGALHVGEATDANTNYMEVREDKLPSGLSMFTTLQALDPSTPRRMGPYEPSLVYQGNIADTAALEAWIGSLSKS